MSLIVWEAFFYFHKYLWSIGIFLACFSLSISVLANLWSSTSDGFSHLLIKFSNTFHLRKSVFSPTAGIEGYKIFKNRFCNLWYSMIPLSQCLLRWDAIFGIVDCRTQLFHDKYQRSHQGNLVSLGGNSNERIEVGLAVEGGMVVSSVVRGRGGGVGWWGGLPYMERGGVSQITCGELWVPYCTRFGRHHPSLLRGIHYSWFKSMIYKQKNSNNLKPENSFCYRSP